MSVLTKTTICPHCHKDLDRDSYIYCPFCKGTICELSVSYLKYRRELDDAKTYDERYAATNKFFNI